MTHTRVRFAPLWLFLLCFAAACSAPGSGQANPTARPPTETAKASSAAEMPAPPSPRIATASGTTPRPSDMPSPTRSPATLTQLTNGGCCSQPFWFPDSNSVLYLDKPSADAPTGYYRVSTEGAGSTPPALWSQRVAFYAADLRFAIIPEAAGTRVIRLADNKEFRIRNAGRQVQISPDGTRVVWVETRDTYPIENRVSNVMLANLDGSNAKRVLQMLRGGVIAWLDNNRLLMNGRLARESEQATLFVYDLTTGARTDLVSAERLRTIQPSPDGSWLVYSIVSDTDPSRNGIWVMRMDGTPRKKLDFFGAVQWRDGARLIYVPLEMGAPTHAFYEYNAITDETRRLTPADGPAFKIANGDWNVSPDGNKIVFVNAADNNLWLWRFDQ